MKAIFIALLLCLPAALSCGDSDPDPTLSPSPSRSPTPSRTPAGTSGEASALPDRDLIDLARRFRGVGPDVDRLAREEPYGYSLGAQEEFYVLDLTGPSITTVTATLRQITAHAYFFVQDEAEYEAGALETISADFENLVYPAVTAKFGGEWSPGVDSDPRITILHADLNGLGGYFSGSDEHPRVVVPRSNEREAVYLEAGVLGSPGAGYNALVAHEFQHLVHWKADPNEESWVNEGLSEVAAEEAGGRGASGGVEFFLLKPDTQLTFWPDVEDASVHYAASELFFGYLLDHYGGRERARDLLAEGQDSISGVDSYLEEFGKSFEDVFADWVIANYIDAPSGPFSHANIDSTTKITTSIAAPGRGEGEVGQFAADYLEVSMGGPSTFVFDGEDTVSNGVPEHDGPYWWSNRGDGIDTRLTREFDLTDVEAATLRFATWYEIEEGWDYGYVAVSTDSGETWAALPGSETTDYDPVEAAYGPGYTGESGRWVTEEVDLSDYAGQTVLVRFELVTDDATSFTGFAVDDIEVPEIGFRDDASASGGWEAEGFTRVTGPAKQGFIMQKLEGGRNIPTVTRIELDDQNRAEIALTGPVVIVVSGATDGTAERAPYNWELRKP